MSNILNLPNAFNGRVNIIQPENPDARFHMYERIAVKNKSTEYREAIRGEWENNLVAQVYFSAANVQILQNGLRAGIYKLSNSQYIIPPQNVDVLKTIMRFMYLQYAEHLATDITKQEERLNQLVWDYAIHSFYSEVVGYVNYIQDQSSLVVPLEWPQQTDRAYKQLELKPWF